MHLARSNNCPPSKLDITLLQNHHSAPRFREAQLETVTQRLPKSKMTWSKGGGGKPQQEHGGYRGWSYWRGASSPGGKQGKGRGKAPWQDKAENRQAQPKKAAFPHYDALPKGDRHGLVEVASSSNSGGYVSELQRAVNAARKAEQKVKKLAGERTERVQQWKDYELELKRCCCREAAVQRSSPKTGEGGSRSSAGANQCTRQFATGGPGKGTGDRGDPYGGRGSDFELLTRGASPVGVEGEDADAVIQRAVEDGKKPLHGAPGLEAPVRTPLRRTQAPAFSPDNAYSGRLGSMREGPGWQQREATNPTTASTDPYMSSPVLPAAPVPKMPPRHKEPGVRVGLKDATRPKQPVHHISSRSSPRGCSR